MLLEGGKMSTQFISKRKKQERMLSILIISSFTACGLTLALLVGHAAVNNEVNKSEMAVEALSKEVEELQSKVEAAKKEQQNYETQLDDLQKKLDQYDESVVAKFTKENANK